MQIFILCLGSGATTTSYYQGLGPQLDPTAEVEKVVNPVILDDRKYFQNQNLAENISKT